MTDLDSFYKYKCRKVITRSCPIHRQAEKKYSYPKITPLQLILVKFCHMFVCRYISNTYTSQTTERLLNAQPFYSIIKLMKKRCDKDVALFNWTYMIIRRHLDPL